MFNQTAGSMYEEMENARLKKAHHHKIIVRRIIAILILIVIVAYLGLLLNDVKRYHDGLNPLIIVNQTTKEYDDGFVNTYYSLGWVFRYYNRETITESEIAPFWSKIRLDNVLKRVNDPNLPAIETDYEVPDNYNYYEKVSGVLFFYDTDKNLLGTYKCLLSEHDCEISYSAKLSDDPKDYSEITKMGIIDNRYVFITEYKNKDTDAQEKHVYLYDITAKNLIAEYQNVRYSKFLEDQKGYIDSAKYIVEKNNLWGLDQVIKGQVSNFEDYKYSYISYDETSGLYIFKNEDNTWLAFNANNRAYTKSISTQIRTIYVKNDKMYLITYTVDDAMKKNYLLYNQDGENVLTKSGIDDLTAYDTYLTYTNNDNLYLIDYDGKLLISDIKLYFDGDNMSSYHVHSYYIKVSGTTMI